MSPRTLTVLTSIGVQYLLNGLKIRLEEVGVIVGHLVLEDGHQALQTHPRVDALLGQRLQLRLGLSEQEVSTLRNCWMKR